MSQVKEIEHKLRMRDIAPQSKKPAMYAQLKAAMEAEVSSDTCVIVAVFSAIEDPKLMHGETHAVGVLLANDKPLSPLKYRKIYPDKVPKERVLGLYKFKDDPALKDLSLEDFGRVRIPVLRIHAPTARTPRRQR